MLRQEKNPSAYWPSSLGKSWWKKRSPGKWVSCLISGQRPRLKALLRRGKHGERGSVLVIILPDYTLLFLYFRHQESLVYLYFISPNVWRCLQSIPGTFSSLLLCSRTPLLRPGTPWAWWGSQPPPPPSLGHNLPNPLRMSFRRLNSPLRSPPWIPIGRWL